MIVVLFWTVLSALSARKMRCLLFCFVSVAALTVACADDVPKLEIQPHSGEITKEVGSSLALTCKSNGPGPVTQLEWRDPKNKVIDNTNPEYLMYIQKLSNEPGSVLIFPKLTAELAGEYTCRANYEHTEPLSASVVVQTIVDITWVDAPENQYPIQGRDFKIKCEVQANPAPIVDWVRGSDPIVSDDRHIIENDGLYIKNVEESDDGIYTCRAVVLSTGRFGRRDIKVEVQVPPRILPMNPVSIIEGEQASVKCNASSKPPSTYTWIKEDSREDLATKDRFDVRQNTGLLIINRVEYNDNSKYKCIAENPAGRDETTVDIKVLVKPKIYELLNVTAPVLNDTKIICKAYGRPPPVVLFRKLSNPDRFQIGPQRESNRIILEQKTDQAKGETYGILYINNLTRPDDGLYQCIAENEVGAAYKNGHITIEFPPTFEKTKDYPPVWTWADKPGNLSCIPEAIPNATIKWKLGVHEIENQVHPNMQVLGTGPVSNLIVTPYNQKRYFGRYECIASNKLGHQSIYIELREARVPGPIQQALVDSVTATTIKFSIVGPPILTGLPLRTFIVQYQTERERSWDTARNKTWSVNAPYILENLVPQETYNFRFAATNDVGIGGYGSNLQRRMPMRSVPAEPKILIPNINQYENNEVISDIITNSPYADHFELRWNVPNDNGDPIDSYNIRFCVTQKINGEWRESETECSPDINQSFQYQSYELSKLLPDTTYKIELRAHNAIGLSSPAEIRVKTARGLDSIINSYDEPAISSSMIIGIVIGAVIIILIMVDIMCFCVNRTGILAYLCDCCRSKRIDEDPKLGRDEKEPLSPENRDEPQIMNGDKRNLSVEFDGKQVRTKPVEIGRYSAV